MVKEEKTKKTFFKRSLDDVIITELHIEKNDYDSGTVIYFIDSFYDNNHNVQDFLDYIETIKSNLNDLKIDILKQYKSAEIQNQK